MVPRESTVKALVTFIGEEKWWLEPSAYRETPYATAQSENTVRLLGNKLGAVPTLWSF